MSETDPRTTPRFVVETTPPLDEAIRRQQQQDLAAIVQGGYSSVEVNPANNIVHKIGRSVHPDEASALEEAEAIDEYARALSAHVTTAKVVQHGITSTGGGHHAFHDVSFVDGLHLEQVPDDELGAAVVSIIGDISHIPHIVGKPDVLSIGIDAAAWNWVRNETTGKWTLVDVSPTWFKDSEGRLKFAGTSSSPDDLNRIFGTESGAYALLVVTAYDLADDANANGVADLDRYKEKWQKQIPADKYDLFVDAVAVCLDMFKIPYTGMEKLRQRENTPPEAAP